MIQLKRFVFPLALLVLVQGSSLAQNELVLKDHHHLLRGEVVSSTADSVTFKHKVGDHDDTQTYAAADIDPHSFYIVRSRAVGNDAKAKVQLGQYCAANGLFTRARNQYIGAKKLDKSLDLTAEMAAARHGTATDLVAEAQAAADKGKTEQAFRDASAIIRRFPGTPAADQARALAKASFDKITSEREAKIAASEAKHMDKEISKVQREINRAADENAKAMQEKSTSAQQRGLERSIKSYRVALKKLEDLAKNHSGNGGGPQEVSGIVAQTKSDLIDTYINLGSIYMTQTNYNHALREANAAIAVDANSSTAKSFRAAVATASSDSGITVYGRGGVIRR